MRTAKLRCHLRNMGVQLCRVRSWFPLPVPSAYGFKRITLPTILLHFWSWNLEMESADYREEHVLFCLYGTSFDYLIRL